MKFSIFSFVNFILLTKVILLTIVITAARTRIPKIDCSIKNACHPWLPNGPACSRGLNMNLQFFLDLAPENYIHNYSPIYNLWEVTYAFCPRVDEIQAFNLSNAFKLAGTYYNGMNQTDNSMNATNQTNQTVSYITQTMLANNKDLILSEKLEIGYLSIYGMGDSENIFFPNPNTTYGSVGVIFNTNYCEEGQFGIVNFLVVNITMKNGKYIYGDNNISIKTGFSPTCNQNNMCIIDPSMKCFGELGKANCGTCVGDPEVIANTQLQVWVSYYGTDASGKKLMSGTSNPLNFRAFSGGGVYRAFKKAEARWNGEITEDDLQP
jgi:hypothetical protein